MHVFRSPVVRRVYLLGLLLILGGGVGAGVVLQEALGRTGHGVLVESLNQVAALQEAQVMASWEAMLDASQESLHTLLRHHHSFSTAHPAASWVPGACEQVALPKAWVRAGVVDGDAIRLVLDQQDARCVDRTAQQGAAMVSGPPFPSMAELLKTELTSHAGLERAVEGRVTVVAVEPAGTRARVRLALRDGLQVAWLDVDAWQWLPKAPGGAGQRHALLLQDGLPAGYLLGGPQEDAVPKALKGLQDGTMRALDLDALALSSGSKAVVAWLAPAVDDGTLALAGRETVLDKDSRVRLVVVAAAPWPASQMRTQVLWAAWMLGLALLWWLLLARVLGGLGRSLWLLALDVREAWLGLKSGQEGSAEEDAQAKALVETLAKRVPEVLKAAFGKGERFWSPGPMQRLVAAVRRRMGS